MYSAIKQSGVPLYKLARQGKTVERAPREITIHSLGIASFALPDITFIVTCSRGTYVRTVASDLGDALGCGAHLTALRRLQSGNFSIDTAVPLDNLQQISDRGELMSHVVSPNQALAGMPGLELTADGVRRARCGQKITVACFHEPPGAHVMPGQAARLLWHGSLVAVAHCEQTHGDDGVKTFRLSRVFT
jgi:tRNA pseudouridine55 synthase